MLNKDQQKAFILIRSFLSDDDDNYFCLAGYAGTGKTFLVKYIIEELLLDKKFVCVAPTGKAASVLSKTFDDEKIEVMTIHKLLYSPVTNENVKLTELMMQYRKNPSDDLLLKIKNEKNKSGNQLSFSKKESVLDYDVIIADESSMINEYMKEDLIATGAKIIFIGDPGQLPPVKSSSNWFNLSIDFTLETIQRQALDSPIIRLSNDIRNESVKISHYQYEDCMIKRMKSFDEFDVMYSFDQTITGKNETRMMINKKFRDHYGYDDYLFRKNEKIICLKNMTINNIQLVNGQQGIVIDNDSECVSILFDDTIDMIENAEFYDYNIRLHYNANFPELPWQMKKKLLEIDYSYAITAHKAQGSEWGSVFLFDDQMLKSNKNFRKKWLYTSVTRAQNKLLWLI